MNLTTRDLFEMASLDVLGLLDEDERRDFEQALRAAPPAIQAQIRREQLRIASSDAYLPTVEAPPGFKLRVMDAVREAIVAVRAGEAGEHVKRKIGPFAVQLQRNVSPLWRAASIGLAVATVILGYSTLRVKQNYDDISTSLNSGTTIAAINDAFGARAVDMLTSDKVQRRTFSRGPGAVAGSDPTAAIFVDEANGKAYLMYANLPPIEGGYRLVVVQDGVVQKALHRFDARPGRDLTIIDVAIQAGAALAILPEVAGSNLAAATLIAGAV
ncbi:MAG: hypothetical protein IBJ10_00835 [Phycisphaerales bacterium]|nr:hypothetical protein [Phycisphaerales bacterium]